MTGNEKTTALIPSVGADGGQPPHSGRQVKLTYMVIDNVEYEVIE